MASKVDSVLLDETEAAGARRPPRIWKSTLADLSDPESLGFPWLGTALGLMLVIVPIAVVAAGGAHGSWRMWVGFVGCAGATVFIYMLTGDPAFAVRLNIWFGGSGRGHDNAVKPARMVNSRPAALVRSPIGAPPGAAVIATSKSPVRPAAITAAGTLAIAFSYAALTGASVEPWRWAVLCAVVCGAVFLFSAGRDKAEPALADAIAILLVWLPIEFKLLPDLVLPPFGQRGINLVKVLMVPFLLWAALFVRHWPDLGFNLYLKLRDLKIALIAFAAFTAVGLPLALVVQFARPSTHLPKVPEIIGRIIVTWAFVALPEELLFRGMIQNALMKVFRSPAAGLIVASIIFGAAHLDNHFKIWRYAMLAALAGLAYGWAYIKTRSSVASSVVHTLVDWVWSVFFHG